MQRPQGFASTSAEEILIGLREVCGPSRRPVTTHKLAMWFAEKRGVPSNEASLAGRLKDLTEKDLVKAVSGAAERKWKPALARPSRID